MDCEKFENTLIDELYGELDEVTSAAAKRHVGGCARCASLLSGLRATRRLAVLPSSSRRRICEERILAAAPEAQKVVPLAGAGRRGGVVGGVVGDAAADRDGGGLSRGTQRGAIEREALRSPASMTVSEQGEPVASPTREHARTPREFASQDDAVAGVRPTATAHQRPGSGRHCSRWARRARARGDERGGWGGPRECGPETKGDGVLKATRGG